MDVTKAAAGIASLFVVSMVIIGITTYGWLVIPGLVLGLLGLGIMVRAFTGK